MLPDDVVSVIENRLETVVSGSSPISGGCIAHASRVETGRGPVFVKWSRDEVAQTFPAEAKGLGALRASNAPLRIPEPLFIQEKSDREPGVLALEWIASGNRGTHFWEDFGRGLAAMHRFTADRFGFSSDNFIGRLPQSNAWRDAWPDFFLSQRLDPQVRMAQDAGRWDPGWTAPFERLQRRLDSILPNYPDRSVLHGDLWSGNFMATEAGSAAIFDPATYFGHRETDLAMSELFGGFDDRFYAAYREDWPLEPGYPTRRDIYNLYHLINHLNHFGSGYSGGVARILARY